MHPNLDIIGKTGNLLKNNFSKIADAIPVNQR